jgi:hypothetical protein
LAVAGARCDSDGSRHICVCAASVSHEAGHLDTRRVPRKEPRHPVRRTPYPSRTTRDREHVVRRSVPVARLCIYVCKVESERVCVCMCVCVCVCVCALWVESGMMQCLSLASTVRETDMHANLDRYAGGNASVRPWRSCCSVLCATARRQKHCGSWAPKRSGWRCVSSFDKHIHTHTHAHTLTRTLTTTTRKD